MSQTYRENWGMAENIQQRVVDRAVEIVQSAYVDGRIDESEMEHRLDLIITAKDPAQLRLAVADLPRPTVSAPAPLQPTTAVVTPAGKTDERTLAMLAHLSAFVAGPVGPAIAFGVAPNGGLLKREAAKALDFQLLGILGGIATAIFGAISGLGLVPLLWMLVWFGLTIKGAISANRGEDWQNPLNTWLSFRPTSGQFIPQLPRR